jgi:hypothetical protein
MSHCLTSRLQAFRLHEERWPDQVEVIDLLMELATDPALFSYLLKYL